MSSLYKIIIIIIKILNKVRPWYIEGKQMYERLTNYTQNFFYLTEPYEDAICINLF